MPRSIADIRKSAGGLENLTDEDILQATYQKYKAYYPSMDEYAQEIGYGGAGRSLTGSRISAGVDQYQANLLGLGGAVSRAIGAEGVGAAFDRRREANEGAAAYAAQRARELGGVEDWRDVSGVGSGLNYVGGLAAQSLPYAGEAVAGALTGGAALAGTAARMGLGQMAARTAGAVAASYPSAVGDILSNQREAGGERLGAAAAGGIPYAALNAVGLEGQLARGLRPLVQGEGSALRRLAVGVPASSIGEGTSETGQELINQYAGRMAVDPNETLFNPEANKRYLDSFVGGAALGGLVGGAGSLRRPYQAPEQETDILAPTQPAAPQTPQYGLVTQPAPLQERINTQLGIGQAPVAGKKYASQFEAAYNEPSGQYAQDAATGLERELTMGELMQRGNAPLDLTVANPAGAAAVNAVAAKVARDPRSAELRDTFGVIPTPKALQLYTEIAESGLPADSDILTGVWSYAAKKPISSESQLQKARNLLDAAIIESRKGTTNVSPTTAPVSATPTRVGAGSPLVQGSVATTGPSAGVAVQPGTGARVVGTPTGQVQPVSTTGGQQAAPVTQGPTNGAQAPQAKQTKAQGQTTTTRGAAGTTPLVDTSDDALEIARATGNAGAIEAMREDEAGLRADATTLTDEDVGKVVGARFAKSKNAKRDTEILNAYLTALRTNAGTDKAAIQNAIGDKYGITAVAVRKIGNPSKLVEAGAELGFSAEQVLDLFNVDDNTKAQFTAVGKLESEIRDLRKAYKTAVDADKRNEVANRMAALSEQITKIKEKASAEKAAAFSAGLQEAGVSSVEGESAGFGFDTEREWSRVEGESKVASTVLELSNQIESLQESAAKLDEQGQSEAADAARAAIAARQAKIDAVLADVQTETKPVATKAPDVAEARQRWNDAGRDLTKLSTEDLQVLKGYTASINNKALSDKIAAEISSRGAPQEATRAVQVQSPTSVSVQPKAKAGQGVGAKVRSAEKPAGARQAEAKILTSQEQYEKVTAGFPAPAWADLTPAQQSKMTDLANRDQLNLAAVNRFATAEEKAVPTATTTPEQRKTAELHASNTGGSVVWQEGDNALVRGFSRLTGEALYSGTNGDTRTSSDIRSAKPKFLTTEMLSKMVAEVARLEAADAEKHAKDPFIKFDSNGLAMSANVDSRLAGVVAGWKDLLNLRTNIYVTTIEDARANQAKFTGVHRSVGSVGLKPGELGSMRKMGDGYYIAFTKGTSYLKMLETLAHEMGHVHEREAFDNAPIELKTKIRDEHAKFLRDNAGKTDRQYVEALRARAVGRTTQGLDTGSAEDMDAYWSLFTEWYSDQVSKWATTSAKPVSVVEKFFAKLGAAIRKFYYALKGQKYLPTETMKQFLDAVADRTIVIDSKSATNQDYTSQSILAGAGSVRAGAYTEEERQNLKAGLAVAKLMDSNQALTYETWQQTGWYKGVEGKWRYEVPDTNAKFTQAWGTFPENQELPLASVLNHPALFKAVPSIRDVVVIIDPDMPAGAGSYSEATDTVTISALDKGKLFNAPDTPIHVLLHELQHAVQGREGFARGGNSESVDPLDIGSLKKLERHLQLVMGAEDPVAKSVETAIDLLSMIGTPRLAYEDAQKELDAFFASSTALQTSESFAKLDKLESQLDRAKLAYEAAASRSLASLGGNRFLDFIRTELYLLIGGEVEANTVMQRRDMGPASLQRIAPENAAQQNQLVYGKLERIARLEPAPTKGVIAKNISKLPKAAQQPVRNMLAAIGDVTGKGLDYLVFTSDLVNRATKEGISSAKKFVDLIGQSKAEARANEIAVEKIADMYALVPEKDRGTGAGSVNRFLFDSTREAKWGYGQYRDTEMGRRFDALSKESQAFVEAVFKHGSTMLAQKKKLVLDSTNSEYDAMIAAAKAAGDAAMESKLLNEKKATIKRFQTLFKIRDGMPYAPIKRNGSHVVIAKSAQYQAAEAANDTKLIEKLEADSDHYHVSFTDGKWEGRTLQQELIDQGAFESVELAERDSVVDEMFSGHSALRELTKMRSRVDEQAKAGDKSASKMLSLISQMYLEALAEGSARKSEMRRRGVDGEVDMIRSFAQQGRADANFMASVKYNPQVQDALQEMRTQAKGGNRERKSELFNELAKRYMQSMDYSPSPWLNKLTRMSSIYYLATSPAYYLQNLTQPWMMSVPAMAGRHDYTDASGALFKAYTELGGVMKSAKLLKQQFDFDKVPADVRDAIKELVNRGKIDIGLDTEIGEFKVEGDGYFAGKISAADKALRLAVQKVESINRLSTAMAAYRLELVKGKDAASAINYADRILTETHGDYTSFNAPRAFNSPVGKVALQFRKFQLIQLAFYAKLIKDALQGNDRKAALSTLGYSLAHTGLLAGAMGLPGYAAISWAIGALLGDDDEPYDVTAEIRKAIGDEAVANLVLRGAPTLAGMDISGKVGAGNMLSIMPFSQADLSTTAGRAEAFGTLIGGASLGMTSRMVDGLGLMVSGDWYRGLEQTMPKGVSDAMKAYRIFDEGMTRRNGDVVLPASEVSAMDSLFQAIGISPVKQTVTYERQNAVKALTQNFQDRTTELKNRYTKADRRNDNAAKAEIRAEWNKLQEAKARNGVPRTPLSNLLKAPMEQRKRERETVGGIPYNKATRNLAKQYSEI